MALNEVSEYPAGYGGWTFVVVDDIRPQWVQGVGVVALV